MVNFLQMIHPDLGNRLPLLLWVGSTLQIQTPLAQDMVTKKQSYIGWVEWKKNYPIREI